MRVDMCTDMCIVMRVGMRIDLCTDMCIDMCIDMELADFRNFGICGYDLPPKIRSVEPVVGHACGQATQLYTRVYRPSPTAGSTVYRPSPTVASTPLVHACVDQ